jgi:dTDP-4-dehydrorhamnose 3,5-epimerase
MNTPEPSANTPVQVTPVKEQPSVTADGESLKPLIVGVKVRYQRSIEDARGEITEVYRPSWGVHDDPLVYVYQVSVRPGMTKGWVVHERQEDRVFHIMGTTHWALYDDRPESSTRGLLNQFVFSEKNRALLVIPRGVYHAVRNIGIGDAIFVNMPTRPYDHEDPDKFRLPLKNDRIPFSFGDPSR